MGQYGKKLSKRFYHTKLTGDKNYCVICGAHEKLTFDHVPPKVATPFREIVQVHVLENHDLNVNERLIGVKSRNGSKFRTICKSCNNLLGQHDDRLGVLCKEISNKLHHYFTTASYISTHLFFKCDIVSVMRSVIGHMMSATSTTECHSPTRNSPFWASLQEFVLTGNDPSDTHDFYCWFYPYKNSVSAKNVTFYNEGHFSFLTILSFYPIAFMITKKGEGTSPYHAQKILLERDEISLDLDSRGFQHSRFPFHGLQGNQMMALTESLCVASIPTET